MKKSRGITLVALIITVIIMLILAGVAISAITNGEGLFKKTQGATEAYSEAVQNEAEQIIGLMNKVDVYLNGLPTQPVGPAGVKASTVVSVGDYINYDAGTWETGDLTKITSSAGNPTLHSTVNDVTEKNQSLPTAQGQFGGFELRDSRNESSTGYDISYKPRTEGWRVWDIDETTNVVTLISAGHPESYYHANGSSPESVNILTGRNCSMYENSHAQIGSAHILTGQEAVTWYNKQFGTDYIIAENGGNSTSTFYQKTFSTLPRIEVLENGSYYWLVSAYNVNYLYSVLPHKRYVDANYGRSFGIRILVSLKPDVLLETDNGDGGENTPWVIVEN